MADAMGNQELESRTNEPEGYKVIACGGAKVPQQLHNVILANFLNSLKSGNDLFKLVDRDSYFPNYTAYIQSLLLRPTTVMRFAMLDDVVLGWSMISDSTLHYVWVKKEGRRQGIGQALVPEGITKISHVTGIGRRLWVTYYPDVVLDPWA